MQPGQIPTPPESAGRTPAGANPGGGTPQAPGAPTSAAAPAAGAAGEKVLGAILARNGKVSPDRVAEALRRQRVGGGLLGQLLISAGACRPVDVLEALRQQTTITDVNLSRVRIPPEVALRVPRELCLTYKLIPFEILENTVCVAMANVLNRSARAAVERATGVKVKTFHAPWLAIQDAIDRIYTPELASQAAGAGEAVAPKAADSTTLMVAPPTPATSLLGSREVPAASTVERHRGAARTLKKEVMQETSSPAEPVINILPELRIVPGVPKSADEPAVPVAPPPPPTPAAKDAESEKKTAVFRSIPARRSMVAKVHKAIRLSNEEFQQLMNEYEPDPARKWSLYYASRGPIPAMRVALMS